MTAKPPDYHIDVRHVTRANKISLDLTRHLPVRAAIGPVAIITERPLVLLSVVKKRWSGIIYDVERRYASTLGRSKREELQKELARLQTYTFSANSLKAVDILFLASGQLLPDTTYHTIYLHAPETPQLPYTISHLKPGGLLVIYAAATDNQVRNDPA